MIEASLALLFGLLIGSFLNVCIYRWPRDLSVVSPRSHCVVCGQTIAWYDNIPLLSFVMLGGQCRHCHARISLRYPIVELTTAALFFNWVYGYGLTPYAAKMCVFSAILVPLVFCDLEQRILPDEFTLGGLGVGLVLSLFIAMPGMMAPVVFSLIGTNPPDRANWFTEAAIGAGLPAFLLWGGGWVYEKVRHREGLGLGDVKLVAMVGAFLGLNGALATLIIGSFAGSVLGYAYIKFTHKDPATYELPFGTFLGLAALFTALTASPPGR